MSDPWQHEVKPDTYQIIDRTGRPFGGTTRYEVTCNGRDLYRSFSTRWGARGYIKSKIKENQQCRKVVETIKG